MVFADRLVQHFLFTVIFALPNAASAALPVNPCLMKLTKNKWFSVPFETTS